MQVFYSRLEFLRSETTKISFVEQALQKHPLLNNPHIETHSSTNFHCGIAYDFHNKISKAKKTEIDNLIILGEILLYNKTELCKQLNTTEQDDHKIVLEAYLKWSKNCVNFLNGDYCFVIYDKQTNILFGVRDHFGQRPFFYTADKNYFDFSNNLQCLSKDDHNLNEKAILSILQQTKLPKDETVYQEINRLPPGHTIFISNGKFTIEKYYTPCFKKNHNSEKSEIISEFRKLIIKAIKSRTIENDLKIGVELSGGLDSSGITGILHNTLTNSKSNIYLYSNTLPLEYKTHFPNFFDEQEKILSVADHLKIDNRLNSNQLTTPLIERIKYEINLHGSLSYFNFSFLQEEIYRICSKHNNHTLFSGAGGDNYVSFNTSDRLLFTFLRKAKLFKAFNFCKTKSNKPLLYLIKNIISELNSSIKRRKENKLIFDLTFLNKNHPLFKKIRYDFFRSRSKTLFMGINSTLKNQVYRNLSDRFETCYQNTNYHGLNLMYPLMDKEVIDFYCSIDEEIKGDRSETRHLFREVIRPFLPNEISNQSKDSNYAATPFGRVVIQENYLLIIDFIKTIPIHHQIFKFIDRRKIINFSPNIESLNRNLILQFMQLKKIVELYFLIEQKKVHLET